MSQHTPRGRHRAPSRLSSAVSSTARVSAAVAVSGGLVAAVAAPADAATAVGTVVPGAAPAAPVAAPAAPVAPVAAPPVGSVAASGAIAHGRVTLPRIEFADDLIIVKKARKSETKSEPKRDFRSERSAQPQRTERKKRERTEHSHATSTPERRTTTDRDEAPTRTTSRSTERPEAPKTEPAPAPTAPASSKGAQVVEIAKRYIGTPYVYGGSTPSGFDCSGFTSYVYRQIGIELPRTARAQQAFATRTSSPRPGDLVFYNYPATHVMIYVGNGLVIDSPSPGKTVQVHKMWGSNISYGRVM